MNTDDPKLTAFALDELEEPMKSEVAREIAGSPVAQRFVAETRATADALKRGFAVQFETESALPANIMDIHDEPWFWSQARPLAVAAAIAVLAVLTAITLTTYRPRNSSNVAESPLTGETEIEAEQSSVDSASQLVGPDRISNPLRRETIQQIARVVVGELTDPHLETGEIRVIETINDAYRVQHLKARLATPTLSKKANRGLVARKYELLFLDASGNIVASADFYRAGDSQFVLDLSKFGYEKNGRYFVGSNQGVLPGEWHSDVDYSGYTIPFSDWSEGIGYSPGA